MALYLIRHGETDWNREQRFQSTTDMPLNARGVSQALAIRDLLRRRGVTFAAARSSTLSRALQTASIILAETKNIAIYTSIPNIPFSTHVCRTLL